MTTWVNTTKTISGVTIMRSNKPKPLVRWHVKHINGNAYEVYLPKMPLAKVKACMLQDAKSDGTELAWYREIKT